MQKGDMLVRLYKLPELSPVLKEQQEAGVLIRRAIAPEKHLVLSWVSKEFGPGWADEAEIALSHLPVSCFIALSEGRIIGFACHEATGKGLFGPIGVSSTIRKKGTGKALVLACMHAMRESGYFYGVIGGGSWLADFYCKACGATVIEDSHPGIYEGQLKDEK